MSLPQGVVCHPAEEGEDHLQFVVLAFVDRVDLLLSTLPLQLEEPDLHVSHPKVVETPV